MLKVRYVRLKLDPVVLKSLSQRAYSLGSSQLQVVQVDSSGFVLRYTTIRHLSAIEILGDGTERTTSIPTMERHSLRIFTAGSHAFMALLDPPRGSRIQTDVLSALIPDQNYFLEPLEISKPLISRHIKEFDSARLVSAKVRDLRITENAVGRLEVTSKEGLEDDLAPMLQGKFYRIDSMTYEVTHDFKRGLVTYISNGTVRVTSPLVEVAFPKFEHVLGNI
ncbi:hypothetical protein J7U46_13345 [Pelomonas sp. V22]|uniref:hypothetical protein n=1 Tax=Pelomonas sp. V22 TaxID=2822139 RepID=UPI0024A7EDD0|nr:hypothetical protein [Pelomonas sp. V22]MDI4634037.1 hypothetical protein [Pelomonas sp. V22]